MNHKQSHKAIDVSHNEIVDLTPREEEKQTAYLDALPKIEQIKLAAQAADMSVIDFLLHVSSLHRDMDDSANNLFDTGPIPYRNPVEIEYLIK